ncbi:glycoside hydrolase family 43 protein [Microbispora siamensis]
MMGGLAALTLGAGALVPSAASAADEGLALWYKLDETSGTVASDSSGNGRNGTLNGDASWGDGLRLGGTNGYVKVPDNLMRGMTSITVALDVWIDPTQATPYFVYGFGNSSGSNGNGYLFTTGNTFRTTITWASSDPSVIRSPEGDRFYMIATDLKIYGNGDWDRAQRSGSRSIMVAESTDLVHWTNQRLVQVSPPEAGNTWAPEAYYDKTLGAYVVFWASKLYGNPQHTGDTYNKMVYATTRDFYTFSDPKIWKDPGYSVIDSTVIEHDGTYYRFTKDERNNTSSSPCSKYIIEEKSTSLTNTNWDFLKECIGSGALSRGEGPTIFKSNTEDKWYLFIDEYGGRGYVPFESTDLDKGDWTVPADYQLPSRPRHGTVLGVRRPSTTGCSPLLADPGPRLIRALG